MKWLILFLFAFNVQAKVVAWAEITPGTELELSDIVPDEHSVRLVPLCQSGFLLKQKTIGHIEPIYGCWVATDNWVQVQYTDLSTRSYPITEFYNERPPRH